MKYRLDIMYEALFASSFKSKMHVNFLHPFFESKVDCDVVTSDGYSVANLVSMDFRERSRGFLAAHFIKPPALLLFQLPFPVHVESMIIKPKVGSQISSGIAILVAGIATKDASFKKTNSLNQKAAQFSVRKKKRTKHETLPSDSNKEDVSQQGTASNTLIKETSILNHSYEIDLTPTTVKNEHSQFFTQVAWLNDNEGRTFHLHNQMFRERSPIQGLCPVGMSDILHGEFQRLNSLQKVTHVVLKIARLSGSSVPAIGKVEIWGQPSAHCRPEILEHALGVQDRIHSGEKIKATCINEKHSRTGEGSKHLPTSNCSSDSIPEDFIDPITCEIMMVPLLLPSGHNIDTATLEKHIALERTWGRLPSDPFTGKIFSDACKPVPNSALKVRIDKFLLTSGVNTSGYGRTVGRDKKVSGELNESNGSLLKMNSRSSQGGPYNSVGYGRKELGSTYAQELSGVKCPQKLNSNLHASEQTALIELGHEEAVSESLDSAVHKVLQGHHMFTSKRTNDQRKPSLTQATITQSKTDLKERWKRMAPQASETMRENIKKKSTVLCVSCEKDLSKESIFHLPCQHVMCRLCLLNVTQQKDSENTCNMCKAKFRQMDVVRVHNI